MFIDEKSLQLLAGNGGDGATLFRHEKYVPKGGPDGGDGGHGGDVVLLSDPNLHALNHLAHIDKIQAENGEVGGHQLSTGKSGSDATLHLPPGTQVLDAESGELLYELLEPGQTKVIARGGNGGFGNARFKSSINQAPERHNSGQAGQTLKVRLVLKLIADIGLVGLPNAGKSTLLSVLTAAKPKIADYPFTTLEPQLGVTKFDPANPGLNLVMADLPGLIEGASQGKGLGDQFLRHLERTKLVVHCLDCSTALEQLVEAYQTIKHELQAWSPELALRPELVVLTKLELIDEAELKQKIKLLKTATNSEIVAISAVAHIGLDTLIQKCGSALDLK